jgi:hypothetical protein
MRTGAIVKFGSAQRLVQVVDLTWHDLKLGRRTVKGMKETQQKWIKSV